MQLVVFKILFQERTFGRTLIQPRSPGVLKNQVFQLRLEPFMESQEVGACLIRGRGCGQRNVTQKIVGFFFFLRLIYSSFCEVPQSCFCPGLLAPPSPPLSSPISGLHPIHSPLSLLAFRKQQFAVCLDLQSGNFLHRSLPSVVLRVSTVSL